MPCNTNYSTDFSDAPLPEEVACVKARRRAVGVDPGEPHWGLALSGGGIRSAAFAMGVMQALDRVRMLNRFDYLSTVSGGGYTGGAYSWAKAGKIKEFPFGQSDQGARTADSSDNTRLLAHIRQRGRFLDPGLGAFGGGLAVVVLRTVLLTALFHLGLLSILFAGLLASGGFGPDGWLLMVGKSLLALVAALAVAYSALTIVRLPPRAGYRLRIWFQLWGGRFLVVGVTCLALAGMPQALALIGKLPALIENVAKWLGFEEGSGTFAYGLLAGMVTGIEGAAGGLLAAVGNWVIALQQWMQGVFASWGFSLEAAVLTMLALLVIWLVVALVLIRKGYKTAADGTWGRQSLWLGLGLALLWVMLLAVILLHNAIMPSHWLFEFQQVLERQSREAGLVGKHGTLALTAAALLLVLPAVAVVALRRQKAAEPGTPSASILLLIGTASVVVGLLFMALAVVLHAASGAPGILVAVLIFVVLGGLRNINLFSLHRMYRDRLMEAFMPDLPVDLTKAWRMAGKANDKELSELLTCHGEPRDCATCEGFAGAYPLINTNLVIPGTTDGRYRGRQGDSFLLSPLWSGGDSVGWRRTRDLSRRGLVGGLSLASAVAVSGAAVNAHAGTSPTSALRQPLTSFLLSMFGLQLGYWVPNPGRGAAWLPPNDLVPGLTCLLGSMSEHNRFVQLSDGGHFENLGIYELVRRQVRLIVVSDASADPHFVFDDLGNAVERIRADFGVSIEFREDFGLAALLPGSAPSPGVMRDKFALAERGWAIADIHYPGNSVGRLVYIKSTLVDGLPGDVYAYRASDPAFPHQTTADQFFDEAQFEAYRELGYRLAKSAAPHIEPKGDPA